MTIRLVIWGVLLMSVFLALPFEAIAQTDHSNLEEGLPVRVEDAYPTAHLNRELQLVPTYIRTRDGRDEVMLLPRFEFGLPRNWQWKISAPFLLGSADKTGSGNVRIESFYNFNTEGAPLPALAIAGRAEFPSGRDSAGVDTMLKGIVTQSISNRLDQLHFNFEFNNSAGRREEERRNRYTAILGYSRPLGPDTFLVADIGREEMRKHGEEANFAEAGIRRQLTPLAVISIGGGAGFGDDSPRFQFTLGFQYSLPF